MRGITLIDLLPLPKRVFRCKICKEKMLHVFLQPVAVDLSYSVNLALRLLNVLHKREITRKEEEENKKAQ
jgi:hypothetical protein